MKKVVGITLLVLFAVALSAMAAEGAKDEDAIKKALDSWKTAAQAQELDKIMALVSEKFSNFEYGDKAGLKNFIQDAMNQGYLKNCEVNTANVKTTLEKGKAKATVAPIEMKASFGSATITLTYAKEGENWMITGMDVQMY